MKANIILAASASDLITELQKERGMSALFLNKGLDKSAIDAQRRQGDTILAPFRWPPTGRFLLRNSMRLSV